MAELGLTGMAREEERPPDGSQTHTHTQSGYVITCVITLNPSSAHNADRAPYPVLVGGVSQCEAFNLQNKNAVVELDEVTSLLLP